MTYNIEAVGNRETWWKEIKFYFWHSWIAQRREVLMIYCRLGCLLALSSGLDVTSEPGSFDECCIGTRKLCIEWNCVWNSQLKPETRRTREKFCFFQEILKLFGSISRGNKKNNFDISSFLWNVKKRTRALGAKQFSDSFSRKLNRDWISTQPDWNKKFRTTKSTFQMDRRPKWRKTLPIKAFILLDDVPSEECRKNTKRKNEKLNGIEIQFSITKNVNGKVFYLFNVLKARTSSTKSHNEKSKQKPPKAFHRTIHLPKFSGVLHENGERKSFLLELIFSLLSIALLCNVSGYSWFLGIFPSQDFIGTRSPLNGNAWVEFLAAAQKIEVPRQLAK